MSNHTYPTSWGMVVWIEKDRSEQHHGAVLYRAHACEHNWAWEGLWHRSWSAAYKEARREVPSVVRAIRAHVRKSHE